MHRIVANRVASKERDWNKHRSRWLQQPQSRPSRAAVIPPGLAPRTPLHLAVGCARGGRKGEGSGRVTVSPTLGGRHQSTADAVIFALCVSVGTFGVGVWRG